MWRSSKYLFAHFAVFIPKKCADKTMTQIQLYDTTLRDGAQQEGISFSVSDKLKVAQEIDGLGIHYIEGGWPGANPKDSQFFTKVQSVSFTNAILCSFGSTRRPHTKAEDDPNLRTLINTGTPVVTLVGKAWDQQVVRVLETTHEENLKMIADSIRHLKLNKRTVFFDAEHFFDGYKSDAKYAISTLERAVQAGVDCIVLCDTNGGALPDEIAKAVDAVRKKITVPIGIHAHNDTELAVANTLAAVQAGATQIQGTINGFGERCGNANLCSIIPTIQLKLGINLLSQEQLAKLTEISRYVSELANLSPNTHQPYTGTNAFTHKAGMHVSGITKWEESYQHIDPTLVGNRRGVLVSELSGASNIVYKAKERGLDISLEGDKARQIADQIKSLESRGFQYEGAEASFELLVLRAQPDYSYPFELVDFMVIVERRRRSPSIGQSANSGISATCIGNEELLSEATVKVKVNNEVVHTVSEGNGPVNALDNALRKALVQFYPGVAQVQLVDYKVRILEETAGTESQVRVLIESSDGQQQWRTVGSSTNIIEASWLALADGLEYWMARRQTNSTAVN